ESLMAAKEISYAMALRKAIETYKTFISSTSIVQDFQLKKDIVEAIASGYVDNIKIAGQDIKGRTVCTSLIGYVNPDDIKKIISKKVDMVRNSPRAEFSGLLSNSKIKILNIMRNGNKVSILYQAKRKLSISNLSSDATYLIIDCFDNDGNPMEGISTWISTSIEKDEIRKDKFDLPNGAKSFEIRPLSD
ncbi:MAG: hypothetical protein Q7I93_02345, partial [Syntrophales bacterium]|nr:hypothetical protein [Syntrophales bacterium]